MSEIELQFSDAEWGEIGELVVSCRMDDKRIDRALLDAGRTVERIVAQRVARAVAEARAEAWDEGWHAYFRTDEHPVRNPYRADREGQQ